VKAFQQKAEDERAQVKLFGMAAEKEKIRLHDLMEEYLEYSMIILLHRA
jgi:hypothetical protein